MNICLENMKLDIFKTKRDFETFRGIITLVTTFAFIKRKSKIFLPEVYAQNLEDYYKNTTLFKNDLIFISKCIADGYSGEKISEIMSNIYWQNRNIWLEDKKIIFYLLTRGFVEILEDNSPYKIGILLSSLFLDAEELEKIEDSLYNDIEAEYNLFKFKDEFGKQLDEISFLFTDTNNIYNFDANESKKIKKIDKFLNHIVQKDLHKLLHNTNTKDIENIFFLLNIDTKRKIFNDRTNWFRNNMRLVENARIYPEKIEILKSCDNILNVLDNFENL